MMLVIWSLERYFGDSLIANTVKVMPERIWPFSSSKELMVECFFSHILYYSKTPKKIIPGPILGQDRPDEKNSAKCLFEAARLRVLDRHRATKPTVAP